MSHTSENIIAINQLSLTLKTLEVGYKGRVSKDLSDQYMLALDDLYDRCRTWSDDFMPSAREEYEWLMAGDIDNSEIPQKRATSLAYSATVIRLLAGCYYEWTKDGSDWTAAGRVHPKRISRTWKRQGRPPRGCRVGRRRRNHPVRPRPVGDLGDRIHRSPGGFRLKLAHPHDRSKSIQLSGVNENGTDNLSFPQSATPPSCRCTPVPAGQSRRVLLHP